MLRPDITPEVCHRRQVGCLPDHYGLRVTRIAQGQLDGELELQPWMHAPNGFLHAASVILLADTCAGYATFAHLPEGAKNFTTIELKSNFVGTATQVWAATVFGPEGRKLALFRCTQMILA
jgi:acyl-coenzyme A thioesterase PaaI-like protein